MNFPSNGERELRCNSLSTCSQKHGRVDFDIYDFEILFNNERTNELIRTGQTIGCFYIESPGMRSLLRKLDVHDFEMLTAASSIIRPDVAESGKSFRGVFDREILIINHSDFSPDRSRSK